MKLLSLPEELLKFVGNFLQQDDFLYFLSVNRLFYGEFRRRIIYISLTVKDSLQFLSDLNFRERILTRIVSANRQISLKIGNCDPSILNTIGHCLIHRIEWRDDIIRNLPFAVVHEFLQHVEVMRLLFTEHLPEEFPLSPNLKDLEVGSSSKLINLQHLRHLHKLDLVGCPNLANIEPITGVPELCIIYCNQITNFEGLGKQRVLEIFDCEGLTDVRNFGTIKKLTLSLCPNVTNISTLRGVPDLTLMYLDQISDYSELGDHFQLTIVTENANAMGCDQVISSTPNIGVGCPSITNITPNHHSVTIYEASTISDYSFLLPMTTSLTIMESLNLHEILSLQISYFQHLTSLSLAHCNITNVNGLGNIYNLSLSFCEELIDISALGNNHTIQIISCPKLIDISSLQTIKNVTLMNCILIESYDCLVNVPRLKIVSSKSRMIRSSIQHAAM